ncbi:MAG: hypothetical protein P4L49_11795 [Desulfosporosinus sp.]|nr:hypothetical protein [Desulfosporosinus sp.]
MTLADRIWSCKCCDAEIDRDINAAINIRNKGYHSNFENTGHVMQPFWSIGDRKALPRNNCIKALPLFFYANFRTRTACERSF